MTTDRDAPTSAAEAARQLHGLTHDLHSSSLRRIAVSQAAARSDHLYRMVKAKALLSVEGANAAARDAAALELPLADDVRGDAAALAAGLGLKVTFTQVGDLRLLRELAAGLSEAGRDHVRACQAQVSAWMTVAGMARSERDVDGRAP